MAEENIYKGLTKEDIREHLKDAESNLKDITDLIAIAKEELQNYDLRRINLLETISELKSMIRGVK